MATPTLDEVKSALNEYADWEEVGSVSRAKSYVTAARRWFQMQADSASNQSSSAQVDKQWVSAAVDRALAFIAVSDTGSASTARARFFDVSNCR